MFAKIEILKLFQSHFFMFHPVLIQIHKPDQTKRIINEFDWVKSAAQLLYDPVLVLYMINRLLGSKRIF